MKIEVRNRKSFIYRQFGRREKRLEDWRRTEMFLTEDLEELIAL